MRLPFKLGSVARLARSAIVGSAQAGCATVLWLVITALVLLRPFVALLLLPFGVLLLLGALVFGFWAQTPHFYEQRWAMVGVALGSVLAVQVYDGLVRVLEAARPPYGRDHR